MTYTKLIERLSELQGVIAKGGITRLPDSETVREAEDAIEAQANQIDALAGELNDMKDWKDFMRDKMDVQLSQQWIQKIMARLADLLDEDQFAEIEVMVLRAGAALQSAIEALQGENERANYNKETWFKRFEEVAKERDALAEELAGLKAQEPVAYSVGNTLKWHEGKGMTNAQLFAAPKALAPTVLKPFTPCVCHDDTAKRYCKDKGKCSHFEAHGIGGTP